MWYLLKTKKSTSYLRYTYNVSTIKISLFIIDMQSVQSNVQIIMFIRYKSTQFTVLQHMRSTCHYRFVANSVQDCTQACFYIWYVNALKTHYVIRWNEINWIIDQIKLYDCSLYLSSKYVFYIHAFKKLI